MTEKFSVTISPHVKSRNTTPAIMWAVVLALLPAGVASVLIFGLRSLAVIAVSTGTAVAAEWAIKKLRRQPDSVSDGSAVITGILLAFNLSAGAPLWLPFIGALFAIIIVKEIFGGLGQNIFNPALAARAFLLASWPKHMTTWVRPIPFEWLRADAITGATPLGILKDKLGQPLPAYWHLFIGARPGALGEVCAAALLVGAAFLLWRKIITWHIPASFIVTVGILSKLFMGNSGLGSGDWLFHILAGGLILGAFFMATDYVTSPMTPKGKIIFGAGCGLLTFIIRKFGGYPEGVSYSILIMNAAAPIIDRHTRLKSFGGNPNGPLGSVWGHKK